MRHGRNLAVGTSLLILATLVSLLVFHQSLGPCPSGSFPCDNGTTCVPQRNWCDSYADCADKEDEDAYECGSHYGSKELLNATLAEIIESYFAFHDFAKNETWLMDEIYDEDLNFTTRCAIQSPHPNCLCVNTWLYCDKTDLSKIPRPLESITHLIIIDGNVTLQGNDFDGYNLSLLYLDGNLIDRIPDGTLEMQTNLRKMYMRENDLRYITRASLEGLTSLRWLFLDHNRITSVALPDLPELQWLQLSHNAITLDGYVFSPLPSLLELFLDNNIIEAVDENTFSNLWHLHLLNLRRNRICCIAENAFINLTSLRELDLSFNMLRFLDAQIIQPLYRLDQLFIGHNPLRVSHELLVAVSNLTSIHLDDINMDWLSPNSLYELRSLKYITFSKFYYCSYVPQVLKCKPNEDGVSSRSSLIARPALRFAARLVATLAVLGNILALWGRHSASGRDDNRALATVVKSLAVSDLLMGVYLALICLVDVMLEGKYRHYVRYWTSSWTCISIGALALTSAEVSMLTIVFMSIDRFLLVVDPLRSSRPPLSQHSARLMLQVIWTIGTTLAVIPIIQWWNSTMFYGTYSAMCFPLHIREKFPVGWQYSAFIFLGLNMSGLLIIATSYLGMFISIYRTRRATPLTAVDADFSIRFFFIVLTNAGCWAPVVVMKIMTLLDYRVSSDVYAWIVVFVLPMNSAVNPLLYTFTTPKYRGKLFTFAWERKRSSNDTESSRISCGRAACASSGLLPPSLRTLANYRNNPVPNSEL